MKIRNLLTNCVWINIVLFVLLTFPTNVQAAYTPTEIASTTYSAQTIVISENSTAVDDVVAAFDALMYQGDWLGFHRGVAPETVPPPTNEHVQGIARSPHTGSSPIIYVTRRGSDNPDFYGSLMVVEMVSRPQDGERLGSNRLMKDRETWESPPYLGDKVVANVSFPDYEHPGGIQMSGDILAIPLEERSNIYLPEGRIVFYDCSTPKSPKELAYTLDFTHKVGVLGFTKLPGPDGHFFIAVSWGDGEEIEFYRSNKQSFFDANGDEDPEFKFEFHSKLNLLDLTLLKNAGFWRFGKTTPQSLNFVTQQDGTLYLIGSSNDSSTAPVINGDDHMFLWRVDGWQVGNQASLIGIRTLVHKFLSSNGAGAQSCQEANFNACGGAYVSPSGELLYYSTSYYNNSVVGSFGMAELRHKWVSRSGTCGPQFLNNHLGGPYDINEGATLILNGEAIYLGACQIPWAQMFEDAFYTGETVMMDFFAQPFEDFDDFRWLDGFNDKLTSLRFCGPPGSILWLFDDDNYRIGNVQFAPSFGTGSMTEIPILSQYHDNEATSALLLWNGYSSQPYSWDLDNDGEFDDAFGPTATFQAGSGNSTNIVRMKYVYSDAWTFTGLGIPIPFPETYVIFETTINVGDVTLAVDAGPDTTISEGSTFNSSGNFTDSGSGPWEATVDYGDGSGIQPLTLNSDKTFTLNHAYSDNGAYTVAVTVSSSDGNESSDAAVVTVENVEPVVDAGPDISIPFVQALNISAGFSDPGANDNPWSFMIDWGDGSPITTGSNDIQGADTVKGTHQYFVPGFYTIVVTVVDKDGGIATDTLRVEAVNGKAYGKGDAPGQNKEPGEPANGKAHGKAEAPGQNKEPGEPADGKGNAPGQNKEPGEPANGKAHGKEDAPGQNK